MKFEFPTHCPFCKTKLSSYDDSERSGVKLVSQLPLHEDNCFRCKNCPYLFCCAIGKFNYVSFENNVLRVEFDFEAANDRLYVAHKCKENGDYGDWFLITKEDFATMSDLIIRANGIEETAILL